MSTNPASAAISDTAMDRDQLLDSIYDAVTQWLDSEKLSEDASEKIFAYVDDVAKKIPAQTDEVSLRSFYKMAVARLDSLQATAPGHARTQALNVIVTQIENILPAEELPPLTTIFVTPSPHKENQEPEEMLDVVTDDNPPPFYPFSRIVRNHGTNNYAKTIASALVEASQHPDIRFSDGSMQVSIAVPKTEGSQENATPEAVAIRITIHKRRKAVHLSVAESSLPALDTLLIAAREASYNPKYAGNIRLPAGSSGLDPHFVAQLEAERNNDGQSR